MRIIGSGSVSKKSGKRVKPYQVLITVVDDLGKKVRKSLGVTRTKEEGRKRIREFMNNPINLENMYTTLSTVFNMWKESVLRQGKIKESTVSMYIRVYKKWLLHLENTPYVEIKPYMIQNLIDSINSPHTQSKVHTVFTHLDKIAQLKEIIKYPIHTALSTKRIEQIKMRTPYTNEEIKAIWRNRDIGIYRTILILIYTGLRIGEFLDIRIEDIDMVGRYIHIRNSKTKSGIRTIPIHSCIYPFIEELYNTHNNKYLILNSNGTHLSYSTLYNWYTKALSSISISHTVHETRHTFASLLDVECIPISVRHKLLGHRSGDITIDVYTHRKLEEMKKYVEMIPTPENL